jgi:hypothetical protein
MTKDSAERQEQQEQAKLPSHVAQRAMLAAEIASNNIPANPETIGDRSILSRFPAAEVRFQRILNQDDLKEETRRRLAAYTNKNEEGWYVLDYQNVGGIAHERGIGLGDILLNPEIKTVQIRRKNKTITAERGVTDTGRIGFLDDNANYVPTFTGDSFKIIKQEEFNAEKLAQEIKDEDSIRETEQINIQERKIEMRAPLENMDLENVEITQGLVTAAQKASQNPIRIRSLEELNEKNPPLSQVTHAVCRVFNVPVALMCATLNAESSFDASAVGDPHVEGGAVGMGQVLKDTWAWITKRQDFSRLMAKYYPLQTTIPKRGENLLADLAAVAIYLRLAMRREGINPNKDALNTGELVAVRTAYVAGFGRVSTAKNRYETNGEINPRWVSPRFLESYQRFNPDYLDLA